MSEASARAISATLTVEEWASLDEDEPGELVDGELEEEEMPTILHEAIVAFLLRVLGAWARSGGGFAFGSELKLVVGPRRGRKPDVSVYLPGRPFPGRAGTATRRPPTIVIEVLSPRPRDVRRDVVDKVAEYAAVGVGFYWLVDPVARTLDVRRLDPAGRHVSLVAAAEGDVAIPEHAGLTVDLDALWREIDELPPESEED